MRIFVNNRIPAIEFMSKRVRIVLLAVLLGLLSVLVLPTGSKADADQTIGNTAQSLRHSIHNHSGRPRAVIGAN